MTDSAVAAPSTPFKGLAPFEDSALDALLFFGREREIEVIAANLMANRLTVLYGPSGVGKTSLLRAGLAQRLRREPEAVVIVASSWGDDPVAALLDAIEPRPAERARSPTRSKSCRGGSTATSTSCSTSSRSTSFTTRVRAGPARSWTSCPRRCGGVVCAQTS